MTNRAWMKERKKEIRTLILRNKEVDDWFKVNKSQKYFINCNWIPSSVESMERHGLDVNVNGISLIDSGHCSCSAMNCNPRFIDKEYAEKLISLYNVSHREYYKELHQLDEASMDEFMEQMAEFNREWR